MYSFTKNSKSIGDFFKIHTTKWVAIEITTVIGCSNQCDYCPQSRFIAAYAKRSKIMRMSFETFKTCIDKIPRYVEVAFAGMAEPWLNPECTEMVLYAFQQGHPVRIYTTIVGLKPSDVQSIESIPFVDFLVHLPSAQGHEKITIDEDYLSTLDAISSSKIKASYHMHCSGVIPAIASLLEKKNIKIDIIEPNTRADNVLIRDGAHPDRIEGSIVCTRDMRVNVLLPNGDVVLCCMDYSLRYVIGNLLSSDYKSLRTGKVFTDLARGLKKQTSDDLCRYCVFAKDRKQWSREVFKKRRSMIQGIRTPGDFFMVLKNILRKII